MCILHASSQHTTLRVSCIHNTPTCQAFLELITLLMQFLMELLHIMTAKCCKRYRTTGPHRATRPEPPDDVELTSGPVGHSCS